MTLYAESSAVLAWLLGESRASEVGSVLTSAQTVVTSDFTLVECDRVLHRAVALGELSEAESTTRRSVLTRAAATWTMLRVGPEVVEHARRRFPSEPLRTLDALHVSSAVLGRTGVPRLAVLSLDEAVRVNASALGFEVLPGDRVPSSR